MRKRPGNPEPLGPDFVLVRGEEIEGLTRGDSAAGGDGDAGTPLPHSQLRRRLSRTRKMLSLARISVRLPGWRW